MSHLFSFYFSCSATSFYEGTGWCEEPRWILIQRCEQGWEDRGGGQRENQEDRRRECEFFPLSL